MKFDGYYFKHQNEKNTIAFIPGIADGCRFIQVVTDDKAYWFDGFGKCRFSDKGAIIDIQNDEVCIKGQIRYGKLTPLKYDIMGPFKYFPMECRHGIISMRHKLCGWVSINGKTTDFSSGLGYIEKDSGVSFPKSYLWMQCNFMRNCSVSVSVADIPFMGLRFKGCICVVYYKGREYRLATYLGVRVLCCNSERVVLKQGRYVLVVNVSPQKGHRLPAPQNGKMSRIITECLACPARVRFFEKGRLLFDLRSDRASFEVSTNL
ncbi:MAG: hypothetical protein FWD34_05820 [Oscillospiraceae bacterium]|nr:hypothetical protein [Oscillospiraceae bacterium]